MLSDKTEQLVVKVSKQMHQQLCEKARTTGTGLSELIRMAISASIKEAGSCKAQDKTGGC